MKSAYDITPEEKAQGEKDKAEALAAIVATIRAEKAAGKVRRPVRWQYQNSNFGMGL